MEFFCIRHPEGRRIQRSWFLYRKGIHSNIISSESRVLGRNREILLCYSQFLSFLRRQESSVPFSFRTFMTKSTKSPSFSFARFVFCSRFVF